LGYANFDMVKTLCYWPASAYQMLVFLAARLLGVGSVSLEWESFTDSKAGFYTVPIYGIRNVERLSLDSSLCLQVMYKPSCHHFLIYLF